MKKNKKKLIIICSVVIVIVVLLVLLYLSLFSGSNSSRFKEGYKLSKTEIKEVKEKVKEVDEVRKVEVQAKNKIISIIVHLKEDVSFDKMKEIANSTISSFSEENLSYYDIEFFIDSDNEESEVYPKIGAKFKSNSEFSW